MAIEAFDYELVQAWIMAWQSASQWSGDSFMQLVPPPAETGLRILNKGRKQRNKPKPDGNVHPQVSHPGSFAQLVEYVSIGMDTSAGVAAKAALLANLTQRIKQIGSFSDQEIETVLNTDIPIDLGETVYIHSVDGKLVMTKQPPPGFVADTIADGITLPVLSATYSIPDLLQELPVQITKRPFITMPKDNGTDARVAVDQVRWTPSTGYNNLLGTVTFANSIVGKGGVRLSIEI